MSQPVKRRPYRSPLRADQARLTRRRITDAARELFLTLGCRTTIARVAAEADVAADTVYHLFGSKRDLLKHVLDVTIGATTRTWRCRSVTTRKPCGSKRTKAARSRCSPRNQRSSSASVPRRHARSAAAVDADIAALRDDVQLRQRRQAMTTVAGWIAHAARWRRPERRRRRRDDLDAHER
jgi:AcrR family transcriptional regulator